MTRPTQKTLAAALALAAALGLGTFLVVRSVAAPTVSVEPSAGTPQAGATRPHEPPGANGQRPAVREPRSPQLTNEWRAELSAKVSGLQRPGEEAFSAYADRFVDENLELAQEQARAEGLTLPEVRALTRLGLMVMATQRLTEVEEVLGHDLSTEIKQALTELVYQQNGEFQRQMRELVAKQAPEAERWELLSAADRRYREAFLATAAMNAEQFDDLLAGNLLLPDSPPGGESTALEPRKQDTAVPAPRPVEYPLLTL